MPRSEFDALLLNHANSFPEVTVWQGARATAAHLRAGRIAEVEVVRDGTVHTVRPRVVLVADGVRSTFGKMLGRQWHRGEVYGIAARSYCSTPMSDEPWIHSHLELRDDSGIIQPGYGWIFPLGNGSVNLGCGALSTDKRPARVNTKKLLNTYARQVGDHWDMGKPTEVASAMLPMGGAVSGVAGTNWMLLGDAAACVNPLNGEGIDYGMETAFLAADLAVTEKDFTFVWPHLLREHYGEAFLLARTLARLLTYPQFLPAMGPFGLRVPPVMRVATKLMGNLIDDDRNVIEQLWHRAGRALVGTRGERPLWS